MLAQMIWSTIVYLFLTSLGAPRTNKNNNVVNLYHQMFSFFHLLQLKGVSSLTSWIEIIKWREFDAAAECVRVKCWLALACTVGLGIEEELILDQSRGAGFCLRLFLPEAHLELHWCWPKLVVIVWCGWNDNSDVDVPASTATKVVPGVSIKKLCQKK